MLKQAKGLVMPLLHAEGCCKQAYRTLFSGFRGVNRDIITFMQQKVDLSPAAVKYWIKQSKFELLREEHSYLSERHAILGPDLATAHFMVARGAEVKLKGQDFWVRKTAEGKVPLPNKVDKSIKLEAVDASGTDIMYESFDNFVHLGCLRYLNLSKCRYIDDWCLDRLGRLRDTLEHLDLSGCPAVTEKGLASLHKLNLRTLRVFDMPGVANPELTTLMLEEILPRCKIESGLDCAQPTVAPQSSNLQIESEEELRSLPGVILNEDMTYPQDLHKAQSQH